VGTLIMLLHDSCDVLMEGAKIAKYCNMEDLATVLFGGFTVAWLLLRLMFFPLVVIRSTINESWKAVEWTPVYYMFNGLLCMLLTLHVYWFRLILRIIYMQLVTGTAHDVREDEDD
jgi:ceramide synthetase